MKNIKAALVFADKTSNVYKVPKKQYKKLVNNTINDNLQNDQPENTRSDKQPRKKHTKEQESNKVIKRMFINGKQNRLITLKVISPTSKKTYCQTFESSKK